MLVPAEVWTVAKAEQGNAVLVRPLGLDVAVPIFIAPLEAQSILIGLGSVKMPRPLTHDLFISVLESLESSVNRVEITSLKDSTYYAKLILESEGAEIHFRNARVLELPPGVTTPEQTAPERK